MARRAKSLTPTEMQRRWRAKKRKAEGKPPRRSKPLTPAERTARHRANKKRKEKAATYAAAREKRRLARGGEGEGSIDLRIGDCRKVLANIPDASVALILTDPPYKDEADPLYVWLAGFAMRTLIPGGSLICFCGHHRMPRDLDIFRAAGLRWWWCMSLRHDQSKALPGKFVTPGHKPVLWFVKERRRNSEVIYDVLTSAWRNKDAHDWGQGEGGIEPLVKALTRKGETVVDPFAGTGEWGEICAACGCHWIGADLVAGGSTRISAEAAE